MKRLTLNDIAKANLKINRKAYISLFLGILLAVYLASATSLCAWGTLRGHEEQMARKVGWMDMFLLGSGGPSDEKLRESGFFRTIGHVTVNASAADGAVCAGYYDEAAAELMNRTLTEGRLPEKAGEIAAERGALIRLGMGKAAVGDTLTLVMHAIRGADEEKTFTLTGILNEQSSYLETYRDEEGMRFPALLESPEETYAVGSAEVHRVLTYAPLVTMNQVMRKMPEDMSMAYGVSRENGQVVFWDSGWERASRMLNRILVWAVLGAALMLSACVGISSAMESLLSRKTRDIGMLRAIGATRRQIRRIYGAEAWLLAATALPAGIAAGIATAWIVSRASEGQVAFSLNLWLLVPILGMSAACVFIASRLPLYRASRRMPMGVLRDTGLLRRAGDIRNRRFFDPARLIAERRTRLHPLRRMGAAGMTALTLLSALILGELVLGMNEGRREDTAAFMMYTQDVIETEDPFIQVIPKNTMSRQELRGISAVEGVESVRSVTEITMNLMLTEIPEYFRTWHCDYAADDGTVVIHPVSVLGRNWNFGTDWLFYSDEDMADARARRWEDWNAGLNTECAERMARIRAALGISETAVPLPVYVADFSPEELQDFVTGGTIDLQRLDSGEQVLVYAPAVGAKKEEKGYISSSSWLMPASTREEDWDILIRNDFFTAGMPLSLMEMSVSEYDLPKTEEDPETEGDLLKKAEMDQAALYRSADPVWAEVSVGAVLAGPVKVGGNYPGGCCVITTEKGAEALGLKLPGPGTVSVYLSGNPSVREETEIEERLRQAAVSGYMSLENRLELTREYKEKKTRQLLLCAGLILLFFAVSVSMQVSGAAREIRSETRTIGTLRAVGADLKMLVSCYRLPVWICVAAGLVPCLLFYAVTAIPGLRLFTRNHPLVVVPVLCVLAAVIALACTAGIRQRLAAVTRQSIVDNIREM